MTTGNTARIRNLVETARSAINENNHDTEDVDQEDFASVVSATFRDFRRRHQPDLRKFIVPPNDRLYRRRYGRSHALVTLVFFIFLVSVLRLG